LSDDSSRARGTIIMHTNTPTKSLTQVCLFAKRRGLVYACGRWRIVDARMMARPTPSAPHQHHADTPRARSPFRPIACAARQGGLALENRWAPARPHQRPTQDAGLTHQHAVATSSNGRATAAVRMEMHRGRPADPGLDRCTFECSRPRLVRNRHALRPCPGRSVPGPRSEPNRHGH
jgi:hypothetical protein